MDGNVGTRGFLGVERSLKGLRWRERSGDARLGLALAQRLGVPEIVGRILSCRGVAEDAGELFLAPTLRDALPDPLSFKGMAEAVARIVAAIRAGETIAVFGDYDVDGATASALLKRFVEAAGGKVRVYIPDRQREGYGPNAPALLKLKAEGAAVAVTVDCGVTAFAPLAEAARAGLDVVVVDHHVAEPDLPRALAVINPNRLDESGAHGNLAAVGVAFLLAVAVNRALREAGHYASRPEPDLMALLDLVALGTVCDVVPLTGVNRALVAQGLKVMRQRRNTGIAALADVARLAERIDAYHAGFILGPRVNAGGRVGAADLGTRLLATDDPLEARQIAAELDRLNDERRQIEARVLDEAAAQAEAGDPKAPLIFVAQPGWHPGVIGIVASRLKERYGKPALVAAIENGVAKGSGRSVAGVALGAAVIAARQAGLLVNGGGHAMAAGFTAETGKLDALRDFLGARIGEALAGQEPVPELPIDGALACAAATTDFAAVIERMAPFGTGNSEPRFAFANLRVLRATAVGRDQAHVSCTLGDGAGTGRLKAIAFRALESALGPALLRSQGIGFHVAGHLRVDTWQGRESVQLQIDDAAPTHGG
ncbi:MAG: single-stranded-DNA-specific exonuclease RecJ [Alphaproteobacteria bacterium]|nr:single-stranded-DNA-specific exonuclease RecJ [Alphaproteobacteria bacterium]